MLARFAVLTILTVSFLSHGVGAVPGQAQRSPSFEVASVKSNPSRTGVRDHSFPGDRFEAKNVPLVDLILVAYGEPGQPLPEFQVSSGPAWIESDRFDISAKLGSDSRNTVAQKQLMLRSLLGERFKLGVHIETRDMPIYALVPSRREGTLGPQLRHADVECELLLASQPGPRKRCIMFALPSGELTLRGQTMSALANVLTRLLERTVRDRTGLTGGFDADARFNPEGLPGMSQGSLVDGTKNDAPSLNTALQEQLGLKLESARGPVEILVVDHVEHPTGN